MIYLHIKSVNIQFPHNWSIYKTNISEDHQSETTEPTEETQPLVEENQLAEINEKPEDISNYKKNQPDKLRQWL